MKLIAFLVALSAGPVAAQNCAPFSEMSDALNRGYGETVQSQGMQPDELVQLFANTETGSWTIVVTKPNGISCMVAGGQNYQFLGTPAGEQT